MFDSKKEVVITISNRTILRVIAFGMLTFLAFRFFSSIQHPLTLIFVSVFLAMALNPAVSYIATKFKSKSRVKATAVAYLAVMTLLIALFSVVVPPLVKQSTAFIRDVPNKITSLENKDSPIGRLVRRYELNEQLNDLAEEWSSNIGNASGQVISTANRILSGMVSIIAVIVLTFMMLIEGPLWIKRTIDSLPIHRQEHARNLMRRMYNVVTSFVNAQLLIALIGGLFALVVLTIVSSILNVSVNPIALAGIVAMFAIIPTIGNILSAIIVSLVCLFSSVPMAVIMLFYFIVYQQVENATIQPYIQSRSNDLSPMLIFIAALVGIGFGGLLGGFVAIPVAGCIKILVEDYLDDRKMNASRQK